MYTGYSSVTTDNIPVAAPVVFAYRDGIWAQLSRVRTRCPRARIVTVNCVSRYGADMYDFEQGCLPVEDAHLILDEIIQRGQHRPICYASLDNMVNIRTKFTATGRPLDVVRWLPAHYTHLPELPTWADGVQWTSQALGRNLNEYMLRSDFFGAPTPTHDETFDVRLRIDPAKRTVQVYE